ncbi:Alpha/Beta hydrolase protein [Mycena metata]|uniref:Alpha/Beta hydrolase protein n=1 Tax=Mycena metata TaxID=1033252 RepID=A0AAD7I2I8_9AGAR|nr:Alpha/Beta hydrolase protein [Mycena metata]
MAQYSHLSEADPEFAPFLAIKAPPPSFVLEERRKRFAAVIDAGKKSYTPGLPKETEYQVLDHQVEVEEPTGKILVRTLVPTSQNGGSQTYPLFVWFQGGGWTDGHLDMDDYHLRATCVEHQISIVNVNYRLAPEHPHPTPLNDCYSALKWAVSSAEVLRTDLKKGFLVLQIPPVLHPEAVPEKYKPFLLSYEQNKDAPILSRDNITWCFGRLGGSPTDPEISPLLYPSHKGLAPAVIQVCGMDPLRDEGLLYESLLKSEGVKTKLTVYPGVPHGFNYSFLHLEIGSRWDKEYKAGVRWLLDGAP